MKYEYTTPHGKVTINDQYVCSGDKLERILKEAHLVRKEAGNEKGRPGAFSGIRV